MKPKTTTSLEYYQAVEQQLLEWTDCNMLLNAMKSMGRRLKRLKKVEETLKTFYDFVECDNLTNSLRKISRWRRENEEMSAFIEKVRELTHAKDYDVMVRKISSKFLSEYPEWLQVPSPAWKGKDVKFSFRRNFLCKEAFKDLNYWLDSHPEQRETVMNEARITYLGGTPKNFIAYCNRVFLMDKIGDPEAFKRDFEELSTTSETVSTVNPRAAKLSSIREKREASVESVKDSGASKGKSEMESLDGLGEESYIDRLLRLRAIRAMEALVGTDEVDDDDNGDIDGSDEYN